MVLNMTSEGLKGPWQPEEDKDLLRAVELWGSEPHCWRSVSEEFNKTRPVHHRSMKQCRERYLLHLRPDISNEPWTYDEDLLIVQGHKQHGNKWQEIAKMLPGRTESSVKNHWNATLRRKFKFNDPAESAPLRKYIRGLLEADELTLPGSAGASPMASMGTLSQPNSAKKTQQRPSALALSQHAQRMAAQWNVFEQAAMQQINPAMMMQGVEEEWAEPEDGGNAGPNLLTGIGARGMQRGGPVDMPGLPPSGAGAGLLRKAQSHLPPMASMGIGPQMMYSTGMGMMAAPQGSLRGAPSLKQGVMMPFMGMTPQMMYSAGMEMVEGGGPAMLPNAGLRIQTKRPLASRQSHLPPAQGSGGSGSGGPASELTRAEGAPGAGKRPAAGEVMGSDQDSLVAAHEGALVPAGAGAAAAAGGAAPRGQRTGSQRTPHSHATHPMQWEMPNGQRFMMTGMPGFPMPEEDEEEDAGEDEEEEEGAAAAAAARKRPAAGAQGAKGKKDSNAAAMGEMMLGGSLSVSPGGHAMWPGAMMMMPQQMMMAAHGMGGEDGDEDGWGSGELGPDGMPVQDGNASPMAAARNVRKKGRMGGGMPMQGWGPAMMGMMPMHMGMGGQMPHPAAMQMMMQQQAMMQHMGMTQGSPHMGMQMMQGGGGGGSPMAGAGMMPWGPMGGWGMPVMMGSSGQRRKKKGSKLGGDGNPESPMAGADDAGGAAGGRGGEEDDGQGGDEEGSQAAGQKEDAGGAGWEAASEGKRGGKAAGETTRVLPGQARVQQARGGAKEEGNDEEQEEAPAAQEEQGGEEEDAGQQDEEEDDEGGVRRSKRSTRGIPPAPAGTGSPARKPRSGGAASGDPEQQRSSHSQAASQLKKRPSLQQAASVGHAHSDGPAATGTTTSATRSRMAQQHSAALAKHASNQPTSARGANTTDSGRGGGGARAGAEGTTDSGNGFKRRRVQPDAEAEAEADSLFGTLLAAAAAIESEGDSLGEAQKADRDDGGAVDKGARKGGSGGAASGDAAAKKRAAGGPSASAGGPPPGSPAVSRQKAAVQPASSGRVNSGGPAGSQRGAAAATAATHQDTAAGDEAWEPPPAAPAPAPSHNAGGHNLRGGPGRHAGAGEQEEWGEAETGRGAGGAAAAAPAPLPSNNELALMEIPGLGLGGGALDMLMGGLGNRPDMSMMMGGRGGLNNPFPMATGPLGPYLSVKRDKAGQGHLVPTAPKSKTAWSKTESDLLCKFVDEYGGTANTTPWTFVAHKLNTAMREAHARIGPGVPYCERTSKQCRERWIHNLAPHVCKDAWTEDENHTLSEAHKQYGNQWSRVARLLPGRTENTVKNHWNATLRRKQPARLPGGGISSLDVYMVMSGLKNYDPDTTAEIWAQIEEMNASKVAPPPKGQSQGGAQWQQQHDMQVAQWQQQRQGGGTGRLSGTPPQADDHLPSPVDNGGRTTRATLPGRQPQHSASTGNAARNGSGGGAAAQSGGDMASGGFAPLQPQPMVGRSGVVQSVMQMMPDGRTVMMGMGSQEEMQGLGNDGMLQQQQQQQLAPMGQQMVGLTWDQLNNPAGGQQQAGGGSWEQQVQAVGQQAGGWEQQQQQQAGQQQPMQFEQQFVAIQGQGGNVQIVQMPSGGGGPVQLHPVMVNGQLHHVAAGPGGMKSNFSQGQLAAMGGQGEQLWTVAGQGGQPGEVVTAARARELSSGGAVVRTLLPQLPVPPQPQQLQQFSAGGAVPQQLQQFSAGGSLAQQLQQFSAGGALPQQQLQFSASGIPQQMQRYSSGGGAPQAMPQFSTGGQVQQYSSGGGGHPQQLQQFSGGGAHPQVLQQFSGGGAQPQQLQQYSAGGGTWVYSPMPAGYTVEMAQGGAMTRVSSGGGPGAGAAAAAGMAPDGHAMAEMSQAVGGKGTSEEMLTAASMSGLVHAPMAVTMGNR